MIRYESHDGDVDSDQPHPQPSEGRTRRAVSPFNEDGSIKTNRYGNVDLRGGVPEGLSHVPESQYRGRNIYAICRRLGIRWAPALVGFSRDSTGPCDPETEEPQFWKPLRDGIVIPSVKYAALIADLERRNSEDRKRMERKKANQTAKAQPQQQADTSSPKGGE